MNTAYQDDIFTVRIRGNEVNPGIIIEVFRTGTDEIINTWTMNDEDWV